MRKLWLVPALMAWALVPAASASCSDDEGDDPAQASNDAASDVSADADPCSTYTHVGEACRVAPTLRCFPQCATGGCFCAGGLWQCRTDFSCEPETGPLVDTGAPPPPDAMDDATAPDDAGDASALDATPDAAPIDAQADSANDAESDASTDAPADASDAG